MKANLLFKQIVLSMLGENCILCGAHAVTVHHIEPKGMGGGSLNVSFNPLNGVPICDACHHAIHCVYGTRWGEKEIYLKLPYLLHENHATLPLKGTTTREVINELENIRLKERVE